MIADRTIAQEALFYGFSLERHVPADHLLRSIDRLMDLSGIREHPRPFYSETGRPSIDPELMIRMLPTCEAGSPLTTRLSLATTYVIDHRPSLSVSRPARRCRESAMPR